MSLLARSLFINSFIFGAFTFILGGCPTQLSAAFSVAQTSQHVCRKNVLYKTDYQQSSFVAYKNHRHHDDDTTSLDSDDHHDGRRGPRGYRGYRGHQGHHGEHGHRGHTGPIGPTGATGPIGPSGVVGFGFGPLNDEVGDDQTYGYSEVVQPVILQHGFVSSSHDVSFTPGTSITSPGFFTINTAGNYIVQYSLNGMASTPLNSDFSSTSVVFFVIPQKNTTPISAAPMALTNSLNNDDDESFHTNMVLGSGQCAATFAAGDTVSLGLFLQNSTGSVGAAFVVDANSMVSPIGALPLSNGGSITLIKIP